MTQGTLNAATVIADSATDSATRRSWMRSGNPSGNAITQNWSGLRLHCGHHDRRTPAIRPEKLVRKRWTARDFTGPPFRATASGSAFSTLALDPAQGILFGDGGTYGFSSSIKQSVTNDIDIFASKLLPPTNVAGTAATGGSLASGTYYYYMRSTSTGISTQCADSSDSAVSAPVVVSGSNHSVNLTWTLPISNSPATPAGYCIYRSTVANGTVEDQNVVLLIHRFRRINHERDGCRGRYSRRQL